jgi:hypothetical protein
MHSYYEDIRSRIKDEPQWYDCHGVPRYDKFKPQDSPNIYAEEVVLIEISCQDCNRRFLVEMNWSMMEMVFNRHSESFSTVMKLWLKDPDRAKHFPPVHYGDPPAHGCVGDTMNCYDLRIVEFWKKDSFKWSRVSEYEIDLEKEEDYGR